MENQTRQTKHIHLLFALLIATIAGCFVAMNGNALAYKLMSTLFGACLFLMFFCAADAYFRRDDLPL